VSRAHEGCGIDNPFAKLWIIRAACWGAGGLSIVIYLVTRSWWSQLAWLLMPVILAPSIWWELVHWPSKMYRTWRP
jgi:hypothetical protein